MQDHNMRAGVDRAHFLSEDAKKWTTWVDKEFAICMYPNITRTLAETWGCLSYVSGVGEWSGTQKFLIRTLGSVGMSAAHGKVGCWWGTSSWSREL